MLQFLVEAVVMAATGGVIGILLGIGSSEVRKIGPWPTLIDPTIVAIAFLFSGAVGVFFGYTPPKSRHLDPIDALRYEYNFVQGSRFKR